jgi:hypothetical protein
MKNLVLSAMFLGGSILAAGCTVEANTCLQGEVYDDVTDTCVVSCVIDAVTNKCETFVQANWATGDCPIDNDVALILTDNGTNLSSDPVDVACSLGTYEFIVTPDATFTVDMTGYDKTYTNLIYGTATGTSALVYEGDVAAVQANFTWDYGNVIADWTLNGNAAATECAVDEDALLTVSDDDQGLYVYGLPCTAGGLDQELPVDVRQYGANLDIVDVDEETVVTAEFPDTIVLDADGDEYDMGLIDFTTI